MESKEICWTIIYLVFCITEIIIIIKRIEKDDEDVLLILKSKKISPIIYFVISIIIIILSIDDIFRMNLKDGMRDIFCGLTGINMSLWKNNNEYISKQGIRINGILYKWVNIKGWEFNSSLMNEVLLKLDEKNISFVIHENYNSEVEQLLNKYIQA